MSEHEGDTLLLRMGRLAAERASAEKENQEPGAPGSAWESEASRPLDAEAKRRIVATLQQNLDSEEMTTPNIADHRRRQSPLSRHWAVWPVAALLVTSLSVVTYFLRAPSADGPRVASVDLPAYAIEVTGLLQQVRSAPDGPSAPAAGPAESLPIVMGNLLRVVLTPEEAISATPRAQAFVRQDDDWQAIGAERLKISSQGSVLLETRVGDELPVRTGSAQLLLTVSSTQTTFDLDRTWVEATSAARSPTTDEPAAWRAFGLSLEILSDEPAEDPEP